MNNISRMFNYIYYTFFSNETLIIPRLWLGNANIAHNTSFVIDNEIGIVVNCTPDIEFLTDTLPIEEFLMFPSVSNIRIPVYDSHLEKDILLMEQYLKLVIPILTQSYLNDENILVHCFAGKQRSGIVVASLLYALAINPNTADIISKHIPELVNARSPKEKSNCIFDYILSKRSQTFNYGFKANFIKSFKRLYGIK